MALEQYKKKRDFERTPEPEGTKKKESGCLYIIQKHDASRLHYDFRLELDGVLKSWAVPKGPSLDPDEKRLAVQVEDHPLEYGAFEGTIPEEEYGGGTVMLWDRGEWEPLGDPRRDYEKGHLSFRLHGEKLKGEWALARMHGRAAGEGGKNWLLIKKRDKEASKKEDYDILEDKPLSVATGRSLAAISEAGEVLWQGDQAVEVDDGKKRTGGREKQRPDKEKLRIDPAGLPNAHRQQPPTAMKPQLATLVDQPPLGESWLHEIKYDGYRLLCFLKNGRTRLETRNGKDWTKKFQTVAEAAARLPLEEAILDGEVVVLKPDGTTDFQALQNALKGMEAEVVYFLFDIPHCLGYDLTRTSLLARKQLLQRILSHVKGKNLRFSDHIQGYGDIVLEEACRLGLEGIVSKRADSGYLQKRSRGWLKIKCLKRQEFVLGGYTEPGGSRQGFGALLLGYYDSEGRLLYAGRVGTGFDEKRLQEMSSRLRKRERRTPPFDSPPSGREAKGVHWVEPELVGEIEFAGWTNDGLLRHPAFKGLREDKKAGEVVREEPEKLSAVRGKEQKSGQEPTGREKKNIQNGLGRIAGVKLTNPKRVFYPEVGVTKEELARFYEKIGDWVLPHLAHRPLTLLRCPQGHESDCFYQKHLDESMPKGVKGVTIKEKKGPETYLYIEDLRGLIALVQMGVLEFHPWGCRVDRVERPDWMIFDLDPGPGVAWSDVIEGAKLVAGELAELGLESFIKTSGGKGLHVLVPLVRRSDWDEVKRFARAVAEKVARKEPKKFTATMAKAKRKGKIYIDYLRNSRGATSVAAYSTRARRGAPVSTPLRWEELSDKLGADHYNIHNLSKRLSQLKSDPWADAFGLRQSLTRKRKEILGLI